MDTNKSGKDNEYEELLSQRKNLQKQNEKSNSIMSYTKQAQHTKDLTMKTMDTPTRKKDNDYEELLPQRKNL